MIDLAVVRTNDDAVDRREDRSTEGEEPLWRFGVQSRCCPAPVGDDSASNSR